MKARRYLAITSLALLATPVFSQECATTLECAQQMVDAVAELNSADTALLERIQGLADQIASLETASVAADAELGTTFNSRLESGLNSIGHGATHVPSFGNTGTALCPAGQVMVGARMQSDPGGPHGIISNFAPVCRELR